MLFKLNNCALSPVGGGGEGGTGATTIKGKEERAQQSEDVAVSESDKSETSVGVEVEQGEEGDVAGTTEPPTTFLELLKQGKETAGGSGGKRKRRESAAGIKRKSAKQMRSSSISEPPSLDNTKELDNGKEPG